MDADRTQNELFRWFASISVVFFVVVVFVRVYLKFTVGAQKLTG